MVDCDTSCISKCYNKDNVYLSFAMKLLIVLIVIFLINNFFLFLKNDLGLNINGIDFLSFFRDLFKKDDDK